MFSRGMIAVLIAQFVSALADNALLFAAIALYLQWQNQLHQLLERASHGQRLLGLGVIEDLKYCAQTDILDVLPIQREPGVLVKSDWKVY